MPHDDPASRTYRRFMVALLVFAALGVAGVGGWLAWRGRGYQALLALLVLGWLMLVVYGYRQEERERKD